MARNSQLVRQLQVISSLMRGRKRLCSMAVDLGVSERTVRRDIEALEEAHFPITWETDDGGVRFVRITSRACPLCAR